MLTINEFIEWEGESIPFEKGDTVAIALIRAGITFLGNTPTGQKRSVFCGIGQCQSCLVSGEGLGETEACLLPCRNGMRLHYSYPLGKEQNE